MIERTTDEIVDEFFDDSHDEALTKICPLCGDDFFPTHGRQKFCLSCKEKKKAGKTDEKKKVTCAASEAEASENKETDGQRGDWKRAVELLITLLDVAEQLAKAANDFNLDYIKAYDCLRDAIDIIIRFEESDKT